jgi:hypothetical protein
MRTPGEWSLLWANHETNGWSWTDIVEGIRDEAREAEPTGAAACGGPCCGGACGGPCCGGDE